ncbi:hypothetical protein ACXIUS_12485 [Bosea thiooxidans]
MASYLQAARELDERWSSSLQFLLPTPPLRGADDCSITWMIAATEIDLFDRYAREIAAENKLKFSMLVELYDFLLNTGRMEAIDLKECSIEWRQPPENRNAVSLRQPDSAP